MTTGKVITKEQIDSLPSFTQIPHNRQFVLLSDLRALYDNAPILDSEPVGQVKISWYNDTGFEYGINLYGLELPTQKEYEQWIKTTFKGEGVFKLYKEPQPDRVAALEAKLKEYGQAIEAMVKDGWLDCGVEGLSEPQQKVYDIYQALKA